MTDQRSSAGTVELLPCPFCNRELEHDTKIEQTRHPKIPYDEYCPLKGFSFASDRRDIKDAWNKRVSLPRPSAESEPGELERTVRRYIESAVRWIPCDGVCGPNGLDGAETIDFLCVRMVKALRALPQETSEPRGYERRCIGKDGLPASLWYPTDDDPTPEKMAFDGVYAYEYRPLYAGSPLTRPEHSPTENAAEGKS